MMTEVTDSNIIKVDDWVIISTIFGKRINKLVKIEPEGIVYVKKNKIKLSPLIGAQHNSFFKLDNNTKQLTETRLNEEDIHDFLGTFSATSQLQSVEEEDRDNRNIVDNGQAQKLNRDEIEELKNEGLSTRVIVENLVQNSSTFQARTVFSQEKYVKKKHEKYCNMIRVQKPTVALLADMYYSQGFYKICNFRIDSLSQMLSMCNVRSSGRYMVADTNIGLLTAAVVERLVGDGSIYSHLIDAGQCIQIYFEEGPASTWRQCVEALNLPPNAMTNCLASIQVRKMAALIEQDEPVDNDVEMKEVSNSPEKQEKIPIDDRKRQRLDEKLRRKKERQKEEEKAIQMLREGNLDGLLIVSKNYDLSSVIDVVFHFLAPSQPFAIFSQYMEPLINCYKKLKGKCVYTRLTETWLRHYQVIPARTRPEMNMSGSGGYLLTGLKVVDE